MPEREGLPLAYKGNDTRRATVEMGSTPVVSPKWNRIDPWEYDLELYRRRNEAERLFLRLKVLRGVFTQYDKLDALYLGFIHFALFADALK